MSTKVKSLGCWGHCLGNDAEAAPPSALPLLTPAPTYSSCRRHPPLCASGSGTISTSSLYDRLLGRFSALLRFSFIDGINDHSSSEYLRLSRQALINSRVSLVAKTKSVMADAVQKVPARLLLPFDSPSPSVSAFMFRLPVFHTFLLLTAKRVLGEEEDRSRR